MRPRTAHHWLKKFEQIPLKYFLIAALIFGAISTIALRQNNMHMAELRDAVYAADEAGSGVDEALQDLRAYVTTHMNTSLTAAANGVYPPVQLKYTYSRLVQAAGQNSSNQNSTIYNDAQKYCEGQIPSGFSGSHRLDCIEEYVQSHGGAPVTNIPDSLYKFDFVSPTWSPDLAGLTMLISVLCLIFSGVVFACRLILKRWSND